jgi:hypothetical protein
MTDSGFQVKRPSEDIPGPKAKARVEPTIQETEEPRGKQASNPVKKTETKNEKVQQLEDDLSEEILTFSVDEMRGNLLEGSLVPQKSQTQKEN